MKEKTAEVRQLTRWLDAKRLARGDSIETMAREIGVSYVTAWAWLRKGQEPSFSNGEAIRRYIDRKG